MSAEETVPAGERVLGDVKFKLTKTKDELKLFVAAEAGEKYVSGSVDVEQIKQLFSDIPDIFEPGLKTIAEELKPGEKLEARRIAKGEAPVAGRDGKLLLLVKPFNGNFRAGELERVDPKFVRAFDNIEVGSVVARIYPPSTGSPGKNIFGVSIPPAPGKPYVAEIDEQTLDRKFSLLMEELVSKSTGYLSVVGKKIKVEHTLQIKGDVSYQTGDIDFIGAVSVAGDVKKDFRVEANAEIEIKGGVIGGSLLSRKSSVSIQGAVIGDLIGAVRTSSSTAASSHGNPGSSQRSEILAKTTLTALSLENVYVECGGDVIVEREIRKCSLTSRGAVRIPRGTVIGGEIKVVCGIEALNFGNPAEGELKITLLSDIESSAEYVDLKKKIDKFLQAENAMELHLGPITQRPGITHRVSESYQGKTKKLLDDYNRLKSARLQLEEQMGKLMAGAHFNQALRVNVLGALYPGVVISVGKVHFEVVSPLEGPRTIEFIQADQKFVVHDLVPVLCDLPKEEQK